MISSPSARIPRTLRIIAALTVILAMLAATLMIGPYGAGAREVPVEAPTATTADEAPAAPAPAAEQPAAPPPAPAPAPVPEPAPAPAPDVAPELAPAAAPAAEPAPAPAAAQAAETPLSVSISDAGTVQMTRTMTWTLAMTCHDPQGCAGATVTMEMPEDIGRAPTSMTIPTRNEPLLRYTVSRTGTTVTLRFTEFAANISFAQAITMNAADHTWSVGEKTIGYTATHGGITTAPATARGIVTGDVDSRVYKTILTAGPYYPGKILTYRVGIERKQGANLTGMNATYVDELPPGVEFLGFVDEDLYERNLRGTNGDSLDPMSAADRERYRPYRYEDGKITTVIDDRNDLETRWTNYPSIQYRARVTDAALDVDSRNTITQTECTLVHTDVACAPQQYRTATATFRATPPPPGGTIAKATSTGYRVGAASRDLGFDLRYTNTSPDSHDVVFRDVPHANSMWDPYSVTLVEANDGTDRAHDLVVEYFENADFSGSPAETITVAGARPGTKAPANDAKPAGEPDGETKYKAVRVTVKDVVGFESVLVRVDGRTFIPPEDFQPTATASQYTSRNDVTVAVDGTPVPISQTNPAPLVRTAGYLITQEFARPQGALLTTFDSNTNSGTALVGLGGSDGPHPEGFLLMPEGFTFGADPAPSSLPDFGRTCPYPASAYRFALVTEDEFPDANRPVGVGEILHVWIEGDPAPNPEGTAPHGCQVPVPFSVDYTTIRGSYDSPDLDRFEPNFADPANAHLPRPELWVRDVGDDGTVVPLRAGVAGKWGLEENLGLERTDPPTPGQAAQWHMTSSSFRVIPSGRLGVAQRIEYTDSTAPVEGDYGRFRSATVIEEAAYNVRFMADGTLPMNDVVGYTLLPAPNTASMLAGNPFQGALYDEVGGASTMVPVLTGRPEFADETNTHPRFRLWYSTNEDPCRPESGGRGCDPALGFNQNGDWVPWDADPADLSSVRALRVEFLDPLTGGVNMLLPMSVPDTGVDGEPVRNGAYAINRAVISGIPEGTAIRQTDGPIFAVLEYQKPSATVQVTKLAYDDGGFGGPDAVALDGAAFAVHAFADDGGLGPEIDMGWEASPGGEKGVTVSTAEFYEGRYWLVETRSPEGYELLPRPVAFELTREGMLYDVRLLDPDADSAVAMAFMNVDRDTAKFDIADFTRGELPLTGGGGVGLWALAGAVLVAMAVLIARVVRE